MRVLPFLWLLITASVTSPSYALDHAEPPEGFLAFCERHPSDCVRFPARMIPHSQMERIAAINSEINHQIKAKNTANTWDYSKDGFGDCTVYVLEKRRQLIEAGFPPSALLVTVVWFGKFGHALLMVETDTGEVVLDNLTDEVKLRKETPYTFVTRQSRTSPKAWVYIDKE